MKQKIIQQNKALMSFNMLMWIPRIIFMVIVLFSVIFLATWYAWQEIHSWQAESGLITQRMLYSINGISYHDPLSSRLYPGIIDLSKFQNNQIPILDSSIYYGPENKHLGAKITIKDMQDNILREGIYNNDIYSRIVQEGRTGAGGIDVSRKKIYVLAKDTQQLIPAIAEITVVIART